MGIPKLMAFHEATVIHFRKYDAGLELELEDVLADGKKSRVALTVSPVFAIVIDGETSNALLMEADDGEVLTLEICEDGLFLIIEWNEFSPRKSFTKAYRVSGGNVSVSIM